MPSPSFSRHERIADVVAQSLVRHIQQDMQDKDLGLVSVNSVVVSRDISHAKVYVDFLSSDKSISNQKRLNILQDAAKTLRHKLARSMQMRTTPSLIFILDEHAKNLRHLDQILDKVK